MTPAVPAIGSSARPKPEQRPSFRPVRPRCRAVGAGGALALVLVAAARPAHALTGTAGSAVCTAASSAPATRDGIAVIYFAGRGRTAGADPLAEAVTRGVTARLAAARLSNGRPLRIVTAYPGQVANQTYYMSGTVALGVGDSVYVTARLSTTADGVERWNGRVARHVLDLDLAVEDVARAVTGVVRARLTARPQAGPRPRDVGAFTRLLEGRYYARQFDAPGLQRAIDAFTAAGRDTSYPVARVELASSYARAARWGTAVPLQSLALTGVGVARQAYAARGQSAEGRARAVAAGEALRTFLPRSDAPPSLPDNVEGWRARALRALRLGNASEAESALRRALARDPADAESLTELGDLLLVQGRPAEACQLLERAVAADPRTAPAYALRAVALVRAAGRGRAASAIRAAFADAEVAGQLGRPMWGDAARAVVQLAARDTAGARATARALIARVRTERVGYWDARLVGEALMGLRDTAGLRLLRERWPADDPRRSLLVRVMGAPPNANGPRR